MEEIIMAFGCHNNFFGHSWFKWENVQEGIRHTNYDHYLQSKTDKSILGNPYLVQSRKCMWCGLVEFARRELPKG